MTVKEIADQLREQWRTLHSGGCKIISKGDMCKCHLCLIDQLQLLVEEKGLVELKIECGGKDERD